MSSTRKMPEYPGPAYNLPTIAAAEVAEAAEAARWCAEAAGLGGEVAEAAGLGGEVAEAAEAAATGAGAAAFGSGAFIDITSAWQGQISLWLEHSPQPDPPSQDHR
jgi:hypothetical protein